MCISVEREDGDLGAAESDAAFRLHQKFTNVLEGIGRFVYKKLQAATR